MMMVEQMLKNAPKPLLHIADVSDSSSSSDAPVKFLVRQMNGIMRGELTLDEETSKLYRNSTHDGQVDIRLELCAGASEHFKTDCYVSEVLNRCLTPTYHLMYNHPPEGVQILTI